ncbi:MAG: DUF5666 domain-containing protein [Myxococcota bacterium]
MKTPNAQRRSTLARHLLGVLIATTLVFGCGGSDGQTADNGGIGGTGVSQGTISAFGSIFVNGVRWDLTGASVELDGVAGDASDLRLGMNVRVVGEFAGDGLNGTAASVRFDDLVEGPIADVPVLVMAGGTEKSFTVLGQTILVDQAQTIFADGADFDALAMDQVLEVSGFAAGANTIRASRVSLRGLFPAVDEVALEGAVSGLIQNPDGSGLFEIAGITIRYVAGTEFSGLARGDLLNGLQVDIEGVLRASGDEIDAEEVEREDQGLGQDDADEAEIEGLVSNFVSLSSFRIDDQLVDASGATLSPSGFVVADGLRVEAEGELVGGVLIAEELEFEDEEEDDVQIEAAVSAVDGIARSLTILGIEVAADGETELEDERDGDESFEFGEIQVGDFLEIDGAELMGGSVRAIAIKRTTGSDVVLEGRVTALDEIVPSLSVLGRAIPLDAGTAYFDDSEQSRTEEEFFRTPGDVSVGDFVEVVDADAASLEVLAEADEVALDD